MRPTAKTSAVNAPAPDRSTANRARPRRKKAFWERHPNVVRITSIAVFLVAWEIYGRQTNPIFLSYPTAVVRSFWELIANGDLARALSESMLGFVVGFSISVAGGILVGLLIGRYRLAHLALDPFITALYNTTSVALIPLIQLWFGFGFMAKVVIVLLSAFFPVVFNTATGVSDVPRDTVDVVRAYGGTSRQVTAKVILPSSVPFIMAGIRLAVGRGIVGIVVAEFFTAIGGLGGMIVEFSNSFQTAKLFVPVLTLVALGLGLTELAKWLERRIAPWKETARSGTR
jgi:ABC-type nitrate/sulfonate/bicarbonate transport system permease component